MFYKKVVFKYFVKLTGKNLLVFLFLQACNVIKKETPSQVFSCEFGEIFKNIFLIEHLRWLLLPTLKPLDSLRQLCRWISKLVTVYFISTFLVLVGIFMFILGEHKLSFYISIALWLRRHVVLGRVLSSWFSTLWPCGWGPLILSPQPATFGTHRPCESEYITFFICHVATWLMCHVTLYLRSSHPKSPPC